MTAVMERCHQEVGKADGKVAVYRYSGCFQTTQRQS